MICPETNKLWSTSYRQGCRCKVCDGGRREYQIRYRKAHPEAHKKYLKQRNGYKRRIQEIKYRFNLSEEDYLNLLLKQNNKCAICFKECISGRALAVDHCHKTGKVRGLLCTKCNQGIGQFDENLENFYSAIKYLKKNG